MLEVFLYVVIPILLAFIFFFGFGTFILLFVVLAISRAFILLFGFSTFILTAIVSPIVVFILYLTIKLGQRLEWRNGHIKRVLGNLEQPVKVVLKITAWLGGIVALLCLLIGAYITYEILYMPYRKGIPFDKEVWKNFDCDKYARDLIEDRPSRCEMYYDLVTNHLKKGMTIHAVEGMLGKPTAYIYCAHKKIKCASYYVGHCCDMSTFTLDACRTQLNVCFDAEQKVVEFDRKKSYAEVCDNKFIHCGAKTCDCYTKDPVNGEECAFVVDQW